MWKITVAIVALWLLLTWAAYSLLTGVGRAVDACHPALVTTTKDGKQETTFDCTNKALQPSTSIAPPSSGQAK